MPILLLTLRLTLRLLRGHHGHHVALVFNPDLDRGYLNALLVLIPGVKSVAWLGNMSTVLACIFVACFDWKIFGFTFCSLWRVC